MAIAVNEVILNLDVPKTEREKYVSTRIKEISEQKKPVILSDTRKPSFSSEGKRDPFSPNLFALQSTRKVDGVSEKWKFVKDTNQFDSRGNRVLKSEKVTIHNGELILYPKTDADYIFFFTEILDVGDYSLKIENPEAFSREDNEKKRLRAEAEYVILSKLTDEEIYTIAAAYGVNTDEDSVDIVKSDILLAVTKEEAAKTNKGYKGLIKMAEMGEDVQVLSLTQKAIDTKVVVYENFRWKWAGADTIICTVPPPKQSKKEEVLCEYMIASKEDFEILKTAITGKVDNFIVKTKNIEAYESIGDFMTLKSTVQKDFNVKIPNTAKKADVMNIIKEKLA